MEFHQSHYSIVDSYWMGIRTIANVMSPSTTSMSEAEPMIISVVEGDNNIQLLDGYEV
jgi:hypothetical protein